MTDGWKWSGDELAFSIPSIFFIFTPFSTPLFSNSEAGRNNPHVGTVSPFSSPFFRFLLQLVLIHKYSNIKMKTTQIKLSLPYCNSIQGINNNNKKESLQVRINFWAVGIEIKENFIQKLNLNPTPLRIWDWFFTYSQPHLPKTSITTYKQRLQSHKKEQ